jgi:uncharacterized small protein (DUF1192 family)
MQLKWMIARTVNKMTMMTIDMEHQFDLIMERHEEQLDLATGHNTAGILLMKIAELQERVAKLEAENQRLRERQQ